MDCKLSIEKLSLLIIDSSLTKQMPKLKIIACNGKSIKIIFLSSMLLLPLVLFSHCQKAQIKSPMPTIMPIAVIPRPAKTPKQQIHHTLLVLADDKSEMQLGSFPWPRSVLSKIIARLQQSRLLVIGFTLDDRENRQTDQMLELSILQHGRVVLQAKLSNIGTQDSHVLHGKDLPGLSSVEARFHGESALLPYRQIAQGCRDIGFIPVSRTPLETSDFPLVIQYQDAFYPTLPLAAVKGYLNLNNNQIILESNQLILGHQKLPLASIHAYQNYFQGYQPVSYSFVDVLNGNIEASTFQNKIVIISYNFSRIQNRVQDSKPIAVIYSQWIESILHRLQPL